MPFPFRYIEKLASLSPSYCNIPIWLCVCSYARCGKCCLLAQSYLGHSRDVPTNNKHFPLRHFPYPPNQFNILVFVNPLCPPTMECPDHTMVPQYFGSRMLERQIVQLDPLSLAISQVMHLELPIKCLIMGRNSDHVLKL